MSIPISLYTSDTDVTPMKIFHSFFEDSDANTYFWYSSKSSIYGIHHPDYMTRNNDDHKYARVAFYKFTDIGDNAIAVYINETLDITTIAAISTSADTSNMKTFKVHLECKGNAGRVNKNSVSCTVTNSNTINYKEEIDNLPKAIITEEKYTDESGETKYGVGVWIDVDKIEYILINIDKSISANSVPIDVEHFPTSYTAEYLADWNKMDGENLVNLSETITSQTILTSTDNNINNSERLEELEEKTKYEPHQFIQNTVVFDPVYTPGTAGIEDTVKGTSVIGPVLDRIVTLDSVKKTFKVTKRGIYALQLKNGFYLVQGESRVDLNVYIGSNQIKEMRICSYLKSNPEGEDDEGKVIKNIYSSNVYVCELSPDTDIKLTAKFMNTDQIVLENETMLSITALQYNVV